MIITRCTQLSYCLERSFRELQSLNASNVGGVSDAETPRNRKLRRQRRLPRRHKPIYGSLFATVDLRGCPAKNST